MEKSRTPHPGPLPGRGEGGEEIRKANGEEVDSGQLFLRHTDENRYPSVSGLMCRSDGQVIQ
jgi:hypothetical protein